MLLGAFAALFRRAARCRLILVPHEPTPRTSPGVDRAARRSACRPRFGSRAQPERAPLSLVDRLGVLATLYGAGTMAYVGGGFGRAGLHSVLEPAAWGLPVAFGPRWRNSRDAALLLDAGAAGRCRTIPGREGRGRLQQQWENWIAMRRGRETQGQRAREVVERGLGASARSAEMLPELISARPLRRSPRAGTISPAVNAVIRTSLQRLRTLILRSAMPLPPASCAASALRSDGSLSLASPQSA